MQATQSVSAPRRGKSAISTACYARRPRFAVAQDAQRDNPGLATTRNPGNVDSFGSPNSSDGGIYAIDSSNNLIINPSGPGVGSAGGTIQNVTIVATQ